LTPDTDPPPPERRIRGLPLGWWVLGALLVAGVAIRAWFVWAYQPGFLGYPDSTDYVVAARTDLFASPFHPAGYPVFLRATHAITDHLTYTVALQHAFGLATGVLLYLCLRRVQLPPWAAAIPVLVVFFDGSQLFLEHAVLSEALFGLLVAGGLYSCLRGLDSRPVAWATAAGLLLGIATAVRVVGLALIPVVALWQAMAMDRARSRALSGLVSFATGAVLVAGYAGLQLAEADEFGLTRTAGWTWYTRAADFADCTRFRPPSGTRVLCEPAPGRDPLEGADYEFSPYSPAVRAYGFPPAGDDKVGAFAREALIHQPLDYVSGVARDLARYVVPGSDENQTALFAVLEDARRQAGAQPAMQAYYSTQGFRDRDLHGITQYARLHVRGPLLLLLVVLASIAPFVTRGHTRRGAALVAGVGLVLLIAPVATGHYEPRYAVPAYGPLAAAVAITLCAGWRRALRARPARGRSR
jgi:hypothetical protein